MSVIADRANVVFPARVCFNFAARCNMRCPYCYIPFDAQESDYDLWKRIIDQIRAWGTKGITFGGGDPFMYPEFRDLLSYTADRKFFVHVDTNALEMKESDFAGNRLKMNLLGLPLDGSNAFVHGLMRDHSKHFSCVIKAIKSANHHNIPIKINTVVSKKNIDDLERMLPLLRDYRISRWSLYEFWSLGDAGLVNSADYAISPNVFLEKALDLKSQCEFAVVEIGAIEARRHSYFFVTQAGRAYTVHPNDVSQYLELGSIFENDVLAKWQNVASYSDNAGRLGARVVN